EPGVSGGGPDCPHVHGSDRCGEADSHEGEPPERASCGSASPPVGVATFRLRHETPLTRALSLVGFGVPRDRYNYFLPRCLHHAAAPTAPAPTPRRASVAGSGTRVPPDCACAVAGLR